MLIRCREFLLQLSLLDLSRLSMIIVIPSHLMSFSILRDDNYNLGDRIVTRLKSYNRSYLLIDLISDYYLKFNPFINDEDKMLSLCTTYVRTNITIRHLVFISEDDNRQVTYIKKTMNDNIRQELRLKRNNTDIVWYSGSSDNQEVLDLFSINGSIIEVYTQHGIITAVHNTRELRYHNNQYEGYNTEVLRRVIQLVISSNRIESSQYLGWI